MSLISREKLSSSTLFGDGYKSFSAVISEVRNQSRQSATTTIFLSHSHEDLQDGTIEKAMVFLRKAGVIIYIDSHDPTLPITTSAQTAVAIKDRIKTCKKFILLATNNSIRSKWCNWELGFGDAHKYIDKIALFPITDAGSWIGNEYLRIYPRIEESNLTNDYYKVIFPDGTEKSLADWLRN